MSRLSAVLPLLARASARLRSPKPHPLSRPIRQLNVPAYDWWNEALHGVAFAGTMPR